MYTKDAQQQIRSSRGPAQTQREVALEYLLRQALSMIGELALHPERAATITLAAGVTRSALDGD